MGQINLVEQRFFEVNLKQLAGEKLKLNRTAPDYVLFDSNLQEVGLIHFKNKIKIIITLDSLTVPAYEAQLKKINSLIKSVYPRAVGIIVSKDLPFIQQRFSIHHQLSYLNILSDYKYSSLGINYGLLIKELNVLANAAIIIDGRNIVRYFQISKQLPGQLNQDYLLKKLTQIIKTGPLSVTQEPLKKERPYRVALTLPPITWDYYERQNATVSALC